MASRSNACSELTRFWLEARHRCLVTEGVQVPVPYGQSDIDFVAMEPQGRPIVLPNGVAVGPRFILETKDEHDFDPKGREFGKYLRSDAAQFGESPVIRRADAHRVKFSMLREEHFDVAHGFFGTADFDRVFVVHAIDRIVLDDLGSILAARRIHWLSIQDVARDLREWYRAHPRPSGLRHTLVGDLWHLMVGYCGFDLPT